MLEIGEKALCVCARVAKCEIENDDDDADEEGERLKGRVAKFGM